MNKLAAAVAALCLAATGSAQDLRDPTRPPRPESRTAAAHEPAPVLSAVFFAHGERTAIFNGRLVRTGSVVGPYTIDAVLSDGVRYRRSGQSRELHLEHSEIPIKTPAVGPARTASGAPQ